MRTDEPGRKLLVPHGTRSRLDRFLAEVLPGGSRQRARELIAAGAVRVNGQRPRKSRVVEPGDAIEVCIGSAEPASDAPGLAPEPALDVHVLYEDTAIVALDKPAGMPSTAVRPNDRGTLANFLAGRYPGIGWGSDRDREAGLAHRLDTGTSGVILAARTAEALKVLRQQFRNHEIEKTYLALVAGDVAAAGSITYPIAHAPGRPRRMTVCKSVDRARALKARQATTAYHPLERFGAATLLSVSMRTGVRHQVRVHLATIGHPLIGDSLYNRERTGPIAMNRPLLHAATVAFHHPLTRQRMTVSAPRPPDLRAVLRELRARARRRRPPLGSDRSGKPR